MSISTIFVNHSTQAVDVFGFALHMAQSGKKHDQAKPLKGFGRASVLELLKTIWVTHTVPCTRSRSLRWSTFCTVSRRSPQKVSKPQSKTWT